MSGPAPDDAHRVSCRHDILAGYHILEGIPDPCPACRERMALLEKMLGYRFDEPRFLLKALTHASYAHENPGQGIRDYQRLEFLGDAVLGLALSHYLFTRYPREPEGELSLMRSWLASEQTLADIAAQIELGTYILLGTCENTPDGRSRSSLLEDVLEAVVGSVYLDGGFDAAQRVIIDLYGDRLDIALVEKEEINAKNILQARVHTRTGSDPVYVVVSEDGPEHNKVFTIEARAVDEVLGIGTGTSKKEAEMNAARDALAHDGLSSE